MIPGFLRWCRISAIHRVYSKIGSLGFSGGADSTAPDCGFRSHRVETMVEATTFVGIYRGLENHSWVSEVVRWMDCIFG